MLTLRRDLDLSESSKAKDGSKRWLLRDPVNNKFFKLGSEELMVLSFLKDMNLAELKPDVFAVDISHRTGKKFTKERIEKFVAFLMQNNLLFAEGAQARAQLLKQRQQLQPDLFKKVLRSYMFIKIHLIQPNKMLDRMLPAFRLFMKPKAWLLIAINLMVGIYLTSRQWDYFLSSFVGYMNLSGVISVGVALTLVKVFHELGHALMTRYYGCSVNSMGVAFMMFWPVLYTDTTDAWRLSSKYQRAMIDLAGIMVELFIATVCLTLWNFVDEGIFKSVLFILASTTWILTLAINLNPLMRFDGYFVMTDLLGVENLQERSFALAKWKWREWLFGFGFPPPEREDKVLIYFAFAVMVYKFLLYLGIAIVVYNYFFKLLGLILMVVQISNSLIKPFFKEFKFWWEHRQRYKLFPNAFITFSLTFLVIAWLIFPTRGDLSLPAYMRASDAMNIYTPEAGKLVSMVQEDGLPVKQGDLLLEMTMPDLVYQLEQVEKDISLLGAQLSDLGISTASASPRGAITAELRSANQQKEELTSKLAQQKIVAPYDGIVKNLVVEFKPPQWVPAGTLLMTILQPDSNEVVAYVSEQELSRIAKGQHGIFYSDGGVRDGIDVEVMEIEAFPVTALESLYAASTYGGGLSVRDGPDKTLLPQSSTYRVHLKAAGFVPERVLRGDVHLDTSAISPILRYWNNFVGLWRREAGF